MSSKRWVDGLFRERLEHRKFPVEDGEYEAVRALLEARNSAPVVAGSGKLSAWWLSALVPVVAMLWGPPSGTDVATDNSADADGALGQPVVLNSNEVVDDVGLNMDQPNAVAQASALIVAVSSDVAGPDNVSSGTARNDGDRGASILEVQRVARDQKVRPARSGFSGVGTSLLVDVEEQISGDVDQGDVLITDGTTRELLGFRRTRWAQHTGALAAMPIHREMDHPKCRPLGELHLFGAPLSVKTAEGSASDGATRNGSLYGLEYRVKSRYVSLATGIHYGTYGMQAGQGTADVDLNYVEVPLLAGVVVGFKRFGVLVQGGMSLDFLFDSGGRYPTEGARSGSGFPDDAFNTVNYSWMLRPQATYRLNERLSLSAGPMWKAQLGSVAQNGLLKDARASSAGISAGLTWRLDRSTF